MHKNHTDALNVGGIFIVANADPKLFLQKPSVADSSRHKPKDIAFMDIRNYFSNYNLSQFLCRRVYKIEASSKGDMRGRLLRSSRFLLSHGASS